MIDIFVALAFLLAAAGAVLITWNKFAGRPRNRIFQVVRIGIVLLALIPLEAYGAYRLMNARGFQFFGEIVPRVETNRSAVALTFDDGPRGNVESFLNTLDTLGVKTTFFVNGGDLARNIEPTRAIVAAGHEIGNHSRTHQRMIFRSLGFIRSEIEGTDSLIREAGYTGAIHFRPPYGKKLLALPWYLSRTGRKTIMVDLEPDSYIRRDSEAIVDHVLERAQPGSIILLHIFGVRASREAVPGIVAGLRERGLDFVTVSELLDAET